MGARIFDKRLNAAILALHPMRSGRSGVASATVRTIFGRPPLNEAGWSGTGSFYEEIGVRRFAAVVGLLTLSISLWLFTAAKVRISVIPPDAFFLVNQLPGAYWLGLFSTISFFPARNLVAGKIGRASCREGLWS